MQSYIFVDTKGDEIQATAFNEKANAISSPIKEGNIYVIKNPKVQLVDRLLILLNVTINYSKALINPTENFKVLINKILKKIINYD